MNINRHNYEEFFILYMDNELSEPERRMVEDFVQQHPDLREELDILMQYKLEPDTHIVFEGKEELLKENGHSLVTLGNYPEWLTLYNDRELTPEQCLLVEQFLAGHPEAAREQVLLLKVKLQPQTIVFPQKETLYRKEERVRRIAPVYWRAAAAVLILVAGFSLVINLSKKRTATDTDMAGTVPGNQTPGTVPVEVRDNMIRPEPKETAVRTPELMANKDQVTPAATDKKAERERVQPSALAQTKAPAPDKTVPAAKESPALADNANKPSNNLPLPKDNPNVSGSLRNTDAIASLQNPVNRNPSVNPDPVVTNRPAQPSDIVQASYNENTETLEQPDGKKNKSRGFFRKIARTFEKRTNMDPTDDNRLLVAGLSIKLK